MWHIYKNAYHKGIDKGVEPNWVRFTNSDLADQPKPIGWRIYLNLVPEFIEPTWGPILFLCKKKFMPAHNPTVEDRGAFVDGGIVTQAKYCSSSHAAETRCDSIVIYLPGEEEKECLLGGLRELVSRRLLFKEWFRDSPVPGALPAEGLRGVSTARQPDDPDTTHGLQLSSKMAAAYEACMA